MSPRRGTLVTFNRRPIFAEPDNINRLRQAAATVKAEMPFDITAAVIYLHYNPVKHGLVECPHRWEFSSFRQFVKDGFYGEDWGCQCGVREVTVEFEGEGLVVAE